VPAVKPLVSPIIPHPMDFRRTLRQASSLTLKSSHLAGPDRSPLISLFGARLGAGKTVGAESPIIIDPDFRKGNEMSPLVRKSTAMISEWRLQTNALIHPTWKGQAVSSGQITVHSLMTQVNSPSPVFLELDVSRDGSANNPHFD
jgi:hypothetical protein